MPTGAGGDSDNGDDDNKPAFFAALTTPSQTMPLSPPFRKERRVAVINAHDSDDGDEDNDPAFFAALVTP